MKMKNEIKRIGKRHLVIPDCQVKPGKSNVYLEACGNYIVAKRPDSVICLGDFADMPSLQSHKKRGHISYEGARYLKDIYAVRLGMSKLLMPIRATKDYDPNLIMIMGNHENRIVRAVESDPRLEGKLSLKDLGYEANRWKVIPFLQPYTKDGIVYSHYFVSGVMDRPISKASQLLTKYHQSCFAGHQQGRDIAYGKRADGRPLTAIIAGSFYEHDEDYLSPQSNNHWRGIYVLNEVKDGSFDEMAVSLKFLKARYL